MGYLKKTGTIFIYISLLLAIITFLPGLPPDVAFSEYSVKPSTKLSGKLDINDRLNGAELLHVGELKGAESFDSYNGELYTGLNGGQVVKLNVKTIETFVKLGGECEEILNYHECGKILGLKFDKKGNLYVIDTYKGIFKVDPKGNHQLIIDISKPINNKVPKLPNSLDITENGDIYWTDSSTDFPLYDGVYSVLANPSGRFIRYNAATKTNEVLIENLAFANGVKLSKDESFVLVMETLSSRINKYYLKGPKAGQHEVYLEGLPGMLDNIHEDNNGGFLVTLYTYIDEENPNLIQTLIPHSNLRKMLVRLLTIIEAPFKLIQNAYPNFYAEKMIQAIGSFETFNFMLSPISVVLNLDATGKIVDAAYSTDGKITGSSSAFIHKGYLWIGSPHNEFVARVPLKQAFPHLAQVEKVVEVKPPKTVETPTVKTSTTTAKPVTKTTGNVETKKSPTTTTKQEKPTTTVKPSTTTAAPTTTVKPSTTTAPPTTTVKPSTKTAAPTTTVKPSTTTATPTTTVKPSTKSVPTTTTTTTTVKPSTASQTNPTPKVTTTTTTTKPVVKQNVETAAKPNNKEIKSETVKPVATKPNVPVDSTKQNVKETKPEVNKPTVQNTQSGAQKQVQTPKLRSNESPKIINNK